MRLHLPAGLGPADLAALVLLVAAWAAMGRAIEHPPAGRPSVSVAMRAHRQAWMEQFLTRDPRIFDSGILAMLQQSTSFFASACMIAIGGGLALIGNPDALRRVAAGVELPAADTSTWQLRLLPALILVVTAFLKFVWAHRLFGYCAILMASVPNDHRDPTARPRAARAAEVNIHAAKNFNAGMRAVYFALAGLAWLAGPWALMLATALVAWTTWRREFASGSRRAILGGD